MNEGIVGFNAWLAEHLQQLRRNPGDDLMSQLIRPPTKAVGSTTANCRPPRAWCWPPASKPRSTCWATGFACCWSTRSTSTTLAARPELWPNAVEEILRLESPVQLSARVARRDIDVAGTTIRRGEMVVLYLAGANRDPAVFEDPHRFDIERPNANKHLSFSSGRHFCLGAALARAEGEVGLRSFFDRYPERPSRRRGHPTRHPRAARLVVAAGHVGGMTWTSPQR